MRRYPFAVTLVAIALFAVSAFAADSPQKPGKWQMKMEMEMPGMPFKVPPVTTEVCVTEEDLKDPQKSVPNDPKSNCKVGDYKVDGNTVSWTFECPDQQMKGSGEATYDDATFSGWTKMTIGDQEMKTKYSGKWLGACEK
jgi:hypothetical protein